MAENTALCIVVPCYCEEEVLPISVPILLGQLERLAQEQLCDVDRSWLLLVDDGSSDGTWNSICEISAANEAVRGVRLSRNRGHQNALLCGLSEALACGCDCAVSIDADGQDDASAMVDMLRAYDAGSDVVYGVRADRSTDTAFKRITAQGFYRAMSWLGADTVYNHADYRLLSSRALEALLDMPEVNLFLRGMVPLVGFQSSTVKYDREERVAGRSHYPLTKMLALAVDGATSMSLKPVRMVTTLGAGMLVGGVAVAVGSKILRRSTGAAFNLVLSGVQVVATGVIGEYVGKAYMEAKRRPRWVIAERV